MDVFSVKSDLDLSINFSNNSVEFPREKKVPALRKLARRLYLLQSQGHVYRVHPIVSAKVPIVKMIDRGTGIECDISVENQDGILKSQIIRIISPIDHRFQKLSVMMKTWAKVHSINSSKDHTLNSLSIILLVAFHLQTREPPILPPFRVLLKDGMEPAKVKKVVQGYLQHGERNKESLAELFVSLLSKLASVESLWLEGICASAYEGAWIDSRWEDGRMNVEDFTDRTENVARAVGKAGIKLIYRCIHCSLHDISAFNYGSMDALKLKACLFDAGKVRAHLNRNKRKRAVASSSAVAATKKSRSTEGSNPWEEGIKASHDVQWKNRSTKSSNPWEEGNHQASSNNTNWKKCSGKSSNPWEEGNQATTEIHGNKPHSSSPTRRSTSLKFPILI
ncbi:hypothetical protein Syun_010510 [Stephania yunnanensis]|uniref:Poly(A) RNA polymerase mitochondrial-like central palm domain-containing protein n=1 Tax=Stephania yunnanensis TaxID=152371 RepID=A0AAP0PTB6_9MAGN